MKTKLSQDPYNLIIAGVGGQGNVLASRMIGSMLSLTGLQVTIGETFGASQRGGSVMSHLRVSSTSGGSPQIPRGRANMVVSLEPIEALRILMDYGSPAVNVMCNLRPVHPVGVIAGNQAYPKEDDLKSYIGELSRKSWFVNATDEAVKMGNPVFGNVIMIGALSAVSPLPLKREYLKEVLAEAFDPDKTALNLEAFDAGWAMAASSLK